MKGISEVINNEEGISIFEFFNDKIISDTRRGTNAIHFKGKMNKIGMEDNDSDK